MTPRLLPKHALFVAQYLVSFDAKAAAIAAGYPAKNAAREGYRLLQKPHVAKALAEASAPKLAKAGLTAERTLEELRRVAFSNIKRLFDDKGNLIDAHLLTDEDAAAIAGIEIVKQNILPDDGKSDFVHKIKLWDKVRALETLAKHFQLLIEQLHVTGDAELIALLQSARHRTDKAEKKK